MTMVSLCFFCLFGCVGVPPNVDYSIANVAIETAREAHAPKYSPGLFRQAEEFYRQALVDYEERRYDSAKANFLRARQYAEKSENYSVLKKTESGESE